jgi:hypothetical protein
MHARARARGLPDPQVTKGGFMLIGAPSGTRIDDRWAVAQQACQPIFEGAPPSEVSADTAGDGGGAVDGAAITSVAAEVSADEQAAFERESAFAHCMREHGLEGLPIRTWSVAGSCSSVCRWTRLTSMAGMQPKRPVSRSSTTAKPPGGSGSNPKAIASAPTVRRSPYSDAWPGPSRAHHIIICFRGHMFRMDVIGRRLDVRTRSTISSPDCAP